jgi:hypothetical protein
VLACAVAFATLVYGRLHEGGPGSASKMWLAGALAASALAFMRVPFHLYWRQDAALLAQLPIGGGPLFDAALVRCVRAAIATGIVMLAGAAPLAEADGELFARCAAMAGVLVALAAGLLPAVATWAASLVALGTDAVELATKLGGAPSRRGEGASHAADVIELATTGGVSPRDGQPGGAKGKTVAPGSSSAVLGALPGFASTVVIVLVVIVAPWLWGGDEALEPMPVLGGLVGVSVLAVAWMRAVAPRVMGTILRDVSALDRQRLATLEIRPPTGLERAIAGMLGEGGLPYRKDARLMRRRYPMAFALGALAFLVLLIVGLAQPTDPAPWLVVVLAGMAMYGVALAGRLRRAPIEIPRLAATLPISAAAIARAKLAWLVGWAMVFVVVPLAFAVLRLV